MPTILVKDKHFELSIPESKILESIKGIADQMNKDLKGKNPLFICVLNGAFMFASDLMKRLDFDCEITFIRLKSYQGTNTEGSIKEVQGLIEDIKDRHVIIVEDIIDTGHTIFHLKRQLLEQRPQTIQIASLLFKPAALQVDIEPDYVALEVPNDFIVGYGLDYDGHGRNYKDIYKIK